MMGWYWISSVFGFTNYYVTVKYLYTLYDLILRQLLKLWSLIMAEEWPFLICVQIRNLSRAHSSVVIWNSPGRVLVMINKILTSLSLWNNICYFKVSFWQLLIYFRSMNLKSVEIFQCYKVFIVHKQNLASTNVLFPLCVCCCCCFLSVSWLSMTT